MSRSGRTAGRHAAWSASARHSTEGNTWAGRAALRDATPVLGHLHFDVRDFAFIAAIRTWRMSDWRQQWQRLADGEPSRHQLLRFHAGLETVVQGHVEEPASARRDIAGLRITLRPLVTAHAFHHETAQATPHTPEIGHAGEVVGGDVDEDLGLGPLALLAGSGQRHQRGGQGEAEQVAALHGPVACVVVVQMRISTRNRRIVSDDETISLRSAGFSSNGCSAPGRRRSGEDADAERNVGLDPVTPFVRRRAGARSMFEGRAVHVACDHRVVVRRPR